MSYRFRSLLDVYCDVLKTLQTEPGPMIPAKVQLMKQLRQLIAEQESPRRLVAAEATTGMDVIASNELQV